MGWLLAVRGKSPERASKHSRRLQTTTALRIAEHRGLAAEGVMCVLLPLKIVRIELGVKLVFNSVAVT